MRTLHLHWPTLNAVQAETQLRNAQHALGRLSPLVARSGTRIEVGIDGLEQRNGDEGQVVSAALHTLRSHLRTAPECAIASSRLLAAITATPGNRLGRSDEVCVIWAAGSEAAALAPLPIEWLRLGALSTLTKGRDDALARCELLGVRTLGTLAGLRSGELAARIGPLAEALITLARGGDVEAIAPTPLPRRLLARDAFDLPISSLEDLRFPLRRSLDDLLTRVVRDGAAVGIARLFLARERGVPLRIVARLPLPTADRAQIERLLLAALERSIARLRGERLEHDGIVSLQLRFDDVLPAMGDQLTLLGARSPRVDRLSWSTAALAIRYGSDRVLTGEVLDPDDPRTERRTRFLRSHPEATS